MNYSLVLANESILQTLEGESTKEPVYSLDAKWRPETRENIDAAREAGALVFDIDSVLVSHIGQITRDHLFVFFGYQEACKHLSFLEKKYPAAMEILLKRFDKLTVWQTYCILLREYVWPRDHQAVLQAMLLTPADVQEPYLLAEAARKPLVGPLFQRRKINALKAAKLDSGLEARLLHYWHDPQNVPEAIDAAHLRSELQAWVDENPKTLAYLIVTPRLRYPLAAFAFKNKLNRLRVFAEDEVGLEVTVTTKKLICESQELLSAVSCHKDAAWGRLRKRIAEYAKRVLTPVAIDRA